MRPSRTPLLRALLALAMAGLLTLGTAARAWSPFERNHPLVQQGANAYEDGRYEEALRHFEAAQKELPHSAELHLNRGNALGRLGRWEEARQAFARAAEAQEQPELRQRALYNLGNALAELGRRDEAMRAYRQSLRLNPQDAQARHNLEVLLRNLPPPSPSSQDGGTDGGSDGGGQDAGRPDGGADGGTGGPDGGGDGGQGDGGAQDGGSDGGQGNQGMGPDGGGEDGGLEGNPREEPPEGGRSDGGSEPEEQPESERPPRSPDGGVSVGELSEQEAEKLLDSMKQNENNLQLWRFQKKRPRSADGKDW